ncbi:MAG TPA: HAD-IC family P-type ATPase, partial [Dehalococcoidales bacterium]|nr:HAD-IC family P-type ATPase [Dehalococcoidales bacterium]
MAKKQVKNNSGKKRLDAASVLTLKPDEVLTELGSSVSGLSAEEVETRTEEYGPNIVTKAKKASVFVEFFSHFKSPITLVLIVAAILSGVIGDIRNTIIILVIVLVSVVLDFTQEYRAQKAAAALEKRVATTATTIRNGTKQEIATAELVPGDIVFLSVGDIVPADARVLSCKDFFVDESALTGESFPAEKTSDALPMPGTDTTKWDNYLFMGTSVTNGTATAVVVRTGPSTEFGEVATRIAAKKPDTEFERGLKRFGLFIMQVSFVLVICVFLVITVFKHGSVIESVLFAVSLMVGLTPGLLPMILSINLARGATNMSRKGVIVKRLSAIQNFGSMDILCTDKTGTLTENRVTVILHVDMDGKDSDKVFLYSFLNSSYQTGLRNPMDEAILKYKAVDISGFKKVDEVPFDFIRRRLSVVAGDGKNNFMITKGAPEEVNGIINRFEINGETFEITPEIRSRIDLRYKDLSAQGYRVLSVAYSNPPTEQTTFSIENEKDMIFLGFIAFIDPLKETAGESIELLRQ